MFWSWLGSFLSGPIIGALLNVYKLRIGQLNSQDAKALALLEAEIAAESAAKAEATQLLIAEQGHWFTRSVRPALGWVVILLLSKVLVYDKALGDWTHGHTDALDPNLWGVVMVIIGGYFTATAVERVSRIFKR